MLRNRILCPECFAKTPGEEKCCSHGCAPSVQCVECGRARRDGEEPFSCTGSEMDPNLVIHNGIVAG